MGHDATSDGHGCDQQQIDNDKNAGKSLVISISVQIQLAV
jgi:hypothetical protein